MKRSLQFSEVFDTKAEFESYCDSQLAKHGDVVYVKDVQETYVYTDSGWIYLQREKYVWAKVEMYNKDGKFMVGQLVQLPYRTSEEEYREAILSDSNAMILPEHIHRFEIMEQSDIHPILIIA